MNENRTPHSTSQKRISKSSSGELKDTDPKKRMAWESSDEDAISADGGIMLTTAEILDFAEGSDSTI